MPRILVVDDDSSVTSVLKRGLSYEGFEVTVANNGADGLRQARQDPPDLVVLDVMMPGLDGMEVLKRLKLADPQVPVLMLTAKDATSDEVEGFEGGADDYVVKPFNFDILVARIRALLRRRPGDTPAVLRFSDLILDTGSRTATRNGRRIELTATEYDLLLEFMEHPQRVLSKEFIMDRVWGYDFGGNANIVEVYVKQLRQKLEAGGERRIIHTLRGAGYVLKED